MAQHDLAVVPLVQRQGGADCLDIADRRAHHGSHHGDSLPAAACPPCTERPVRGAWQHWQGIRHDALIEINFPTPAEKRPPQRSRRPLAPGRDWPLSDIAIATAWRRLLTLRPDRP